MKHHAAVQSARERYISRREEILNNFLRIFFTTAVVPFTHGLNRGVLLHMYSSRNSADTEEVLNISGALFLNITIWLHVCSNNSKDISCRGVLRVLLNAKFEPNLLNVYRYNKIDIKICCIFHIIFRKIYSIYLNKFTAKYINPFLVCL